MNIQEIHVAELTEFGLTSRALGALEGAGVNTLHDLLSMEPDELLAIREIQDATRLRIIQSVRDHRAVNKW